jgi:N-acetylglucosamine transport system substrate-binding protein
MSSIPQIPDASRRQVLRAAGMIGLAVPGASLLAGCATSSTGQATSPGRGGATSAANPLGVDASAPLDVVIFDGGYGEAFCQYDVSLYAKQFPNAKTTLDGIQDIETQMQPLFVADNPPDVLDNSGASAIPTATLVNNGELSDLSTLLAAPSFDDPSLTVADTLLPGALTAVQYSGKTMALPYVYTAYAFWYSAPLFQKNGWEWPTTWSGLLALAEEMKAKGIAPFSYGGTDAANYWLRPLFSLAAKQGGTQVLIDIDNLKPGAWLAEPMVNAANAVAQLAAKGYFLAGSAGLSHTQAQTAWVRGQVGMYASGSWLESEMKGIAPAGFDITYGAVPLLGGANALPVTAMSAAASETYVVPAQAKNLAGGLEYLRTMLSHDAAAKFSELTHAPTIVKGAASGQTFGSTQFASTSAAIAAAGNNTFTYMFTGWYPTISKECTTQIGNLLAGTTSATGFLNAMQSAADAVAANPSVPKHHR